MLFYCFIMSRWENSGGEMFWFTSSNIYHSFFFPSHFLPRSIDGHCRHRISFANREAIRMTFLLVNFSRGWWVQETRAGEQVTEKVSRVSRKAVSLWNSYTKEQWDVSLDCQSRCCSRRPYNRNFDQDKGRRQSTENRRTIFLRC